MAAVQKFKKSAIVNILRHNAREIENPGNPDIGKDRTQDNYTLFPLEQSAYTVYQIRKAELYCYNRADVVTLAGWVVTVPADLPQDQHRNFFAETYKFLSARYGENNTVQAVVHNDESGQPHLHYCFIPVSPDPKHGGEKICANNVLTRTELRDFHPALKKHLQSAGINANVLNGATANGNKSVKELKFAREHEYKRELVF